MPSLSGYLKESLALLLVLVALAALVLYAARRAGVGRALGPVEVLARLPLEPRRTIYVVRVLDQVLIIGSSEAGLARLGQLAEGAAADLPSAPAAPNLAGALAAAWFSARHGPAARAQGASQAAASAHASMEREQVAHPRPDTPGGPA